MARLMIGKRGRILQTTKLSTVVLGIVCGCCSLVGVDTYATTIDKNSFTYPQGGDVPAANDFDLSIGGILPEDPKSDAFPNVVRLTGSDGKTHEAVFSGKDVARGDAINVAFKSNEARNRPKGFFTHREDGQVKGSRVSDDIRSLGVDGEEIAFVPQNDGTVVATISVSNPFETTMAASFTAYINAGFLADQFTLDNFDILNNARPFYSASNLFLNSEQILSLPNVRLSPDDYVLILGTASVEGSPQSPFALAFAADVPEPYTSMLFISGALFFYCCGPRLVHVNPM